MALSSALEDTAAPPINTKLTAAGAEDGSALSTDGVVRHTHSAKARDGHANRTIIATLTPIPWMIRCQRLFLERRCLHLCRRLVW